MGNFLPLWGKFPVFVISFCISLLSDRFRPFAYSISLEVHRGNRYGCQPCGVSYQYKHWSSFWFPLRRFWKELLPIPPHRFPHYWCSCKYQGHRVILLSLQFFRSNRLTISPEQEVWKNLFFSNLSLKSPTQWKGLAAIHGSSLGQKNFRDDFFWRTWSMNRV